MNFSNIQKTTFVFLCALCMFPPVNVWAFSLSDIENTTQKYRLTMSDQSFCIADDTHTILEYNTDTLRFPASVSKLYITDWTLNTLGKDFRFKTTFIRSGDTLYVKGDKDAGFISEHFLYAWYRITNDSSVKIRKIIFDPNFYFNWDYDANTIAKSLKLLVTKPNIAYGGNLADTRARLLYRNHLGSFPQKRQKTLSSSSFALSVPSIKGISYVLSSPTLVHMLKQMNMYSTNSLADALFTRSGGLEAFKKYMTSNLNATDQNFSFTTGSGLAGNQVTCRLTIDMLKHLKRTADGRGISLGSIIATPGEEGTLENRIKNSSFKQSVLMKTGNVWEHVTLAGYIQTTSGIQYFAFLNRAPSADDKTVNDVRRFQDEILSQYLTSVASMPFQVLEDKYPWSHFTFKKK